MSEALQNSLAPDIINNQNPGVNLGENVVLSGFANPKLNGKVLVVGDEAKALKKNIKARRRDFARVFGPAMRKLEEDMWLAGLSVMTRQRQRATAREALMRINEWPKNMEPRKIRRKSVLASVPSFVKLNSK